MEPTQFWPVVGILVTCLLILLKQNSAANKRSESIDKLLLTMNGQSAVLTHILGDTGSTKGLVHDIKNENSKEHDWLREWHSKSTPEGTPVAYFPSGRFDLLIDGQKQTNALLTKLVAQAS